MPEPHLSTILKDYATALALLAGGAWESAPSIGPLQPGEHILQIPPWWSTYVIEPNTESLLQEHIALDRGQVYLFRWRLCLAPGALPGKLANDHLQVRRELLWRAPDVKRAA